MLDDLVNNDQWWPDCQSKGWKMRFVVFPKIHFVVAFVSFSNSNKRQLDHFSEYEWEWIYPCYCCWVTTTVTTTLNSNQAQTILLRLVIRDCILYFVVHWLRPCLMVIALPDYYDVHSANRKQRIPRIPIRLSSSSRDSRTHVRQYIREICADKGTQSRPSDVGEVVNLYIDANVRCRVNRYR